MDTVELMTLYKTTMSSHCDFLHATLSNDVLITANHSILVIMNSKFRHTTQA